MAENKKSFVLYSDQSSLVNLLSDEQAGKLLKHIFSYVNDDNPTTDDQLILLAFEPIKQQFKRDLKKWLTTKEGRSKAGKASAESRKKQQSLTNPTNVDFVQQVSTNSTVNDNVNVNVNVNDNVNVKVIKSIIDRKTDFKKILHPFIANYSKELLLEFFEYWSEHGVNDKKMRFEKQTSFDVVRRLKTWENNNNKFKSNGNTIRTNRLTVDEQLAERNRQFEKNLNDSITANMDRSQDDGFESGQFTNFDAI